MSLDYADEYALLTRQWPAWNARRIAALRLQRGWTQEELAEQSGLSVRTIRNLELGRVQNPRRSSVDLLVNALGVADTQPQRVTGLDRARWRGVQPPESPLVGGSAIQEQLAHTVRANRLTTFLGPGGVGKTRLALSVATQVGRSFRDGVAVVELGDMPGTRHGGTEESADAQASDVLRRITRQLAWGRSSAPGGPEAEIKADAEMLLILDNAEHVPSGVMAAVRELLATHPGVHILITTRRRLTQRLGVNREIQALSVTPPPGGELDAAPAVELFLQHVGPDSRTAAELHQDLPLIAELCRRLGGLPRNIEFAAECLRAIPVRLMLAHGPTPEMLWSNDQALLPHQRSATDSILWTLDLFTADHRVLLERIAGLRMERFTLDEITAEEDRPERPGGSGRAGQNAGPSLLTLVSDLLDSSLLVPDPVHRYRYRLAHFVRDVVRREAGAEVAERGGH